MTTNLTHSRRSIFPLAEHNRRTISICYKKNSFLKALLDTAFKISGQLIETMNFEMLEVLIDSQ